MRTLLLMCLVLSPCVAADDAKDVLDKAMAAQGGLEKLAKAKYQSWLAKGKMTAAGQAIEYKAVYHLLAPNKMRFDLDMTFNDMKTTLSAATDGTTGWEAMGPMMRDMPADKHAEFLHQVYTMNVIQLHPLLDKSFKLSLLKERTVGDQTLVGIKVSKEGQRDVSLFFDKKTMLLARTETTINDEFTRQSANQETIITGWRDQDGWKVFDKLTILRNGKETIVEEYSEQKRAEKVDEKLFAKPAAKK